MHVILWDVPPQQFVDSFDPHLKERLTDQPFSHFFAFHCDSCDILVGNRKLQKQS